MLKWLVLSATILIGLIVVVQLYWLTKVYSFEQKQFNNNVVKSLRGVFEDLAMNDNPTNLQQLIHIRRRLLYVQSRHYSTRVLTFSSGRESVISI
jgi:hypothetical protein